MTFSSKALTGFGAFAIGFLLSWQDTGSGFGARPSFIGAALAQTATPVANAGIDRTVTAGSAVVLDGSASYHPSNKQISYSWTLVSRPAGSSAALSSTTSIKPSFTADLAGNYNFDLRVIEGPRTSAPDRVVISTTNSLPVADAGADQAITAGSTVQLDGSRSWDMDGQAMSFTWSFVSRPSGSVAALSSSTAVTPTFVADLTGTYVAQLAVNDGTGVSPADSVVVSTANIAPVAHAGLDQRSTVGQSFALDGTRSYDVNGTLLSYNWALIAKPAGSAAKLSTPALDFPNIVTDLAGTYVAQLTVSDGSTSGLPDTVTITTGNSPPAANAGPDQSVATGAVVTLDGTGSSDVDGNPLTYRWSIIAMPAGAANSLSDPSAARPTIVVNIPGTYVAQLVVSDGVEQSRPDLIVVTTDNAAPIARAGIDQFRANGATAQLNGSASFDPDLDPLTYRWAITLRPSGSNATLSNPNIVNPTFTLNKGGIYVTQLIVSDGLAKSAPDTLVVGSGNVRPTANAGADQAVPLGSVATLNSGGSSDPNGATLTRRWAMLSKPAGSAATLSSTTAASPTFSTDRVGLYVVQLIVSDGALESEPDIVVVEALNSAPVANAGPDQFVTAGATVNLDGSGSSDAENHPLTYSWSLLSRPAGSVAILSSTTAVSPSIVADVPGTFTVRLVVNDGFANSAPDQMTITASVPTVNLAPYLAPVGNKSVNLGSTLTFALAASDPNGDALSFSATPVPLPAGASLTPGGVFTFRPTASQVGSIPLTFIVSDGSLTDSEAITITVVGAPPGGVTALTGRLLDANDAVNNIETPIVNAEVTLLNNGLTPVFSGSDGTFTITNAPAGSQLLDIKQGATGAGGIIYAGFREQIWLEAGVTNVIERAVFLPRIDPAGTATIVTNQPTTVTNPNLDVTMTVPANTAEDSAGNLYTGSISISEVPVEFAPAALPPEFEPALLITIQPTGVFFATPIPITFPNTDNLQPGTETNIWSLDAATGTFGIVGTGRVSADGTVIETISGGIRAADWHFTLPASVNPNTNPTNDENQNCGDGSCPSCAPMATPTDPGNPGSSGSDTTLCAGDLIVSHPLPTYSSLGGAQGAELVYRSTIADPFPVVATDVTIPLRSAVPVTISTKLAVAGVAQGAELHTGTSGLSESADETIRQAVQFDGGQFATGLYPYELMVKNNYSQSSVSTRVADTVLIRNEKESAFGAGWMLDGLQRVHPQGGSLVVLTEGDGSTLRFSPTLTGSGGFSAPTNFGQIAQSMALAVGDLNNDGDLDIAIPDATSGDMFALLGNGTGSFPTIRRFSSGGTPAPNPDVTSVAIGDFDENGIPDLIVGLQNTDAVNVHLGSGGGFYHPKTTIPVGGSVESVGVADFNADGNQDVAWADATADRMSILLGNGLGGFPTRRDFGGIGDAVSLTLDDLDADGDIDAAVAVAVPDRVSVYRNDGLGFFSAPTNLGSGDIGNFVGNWVVDTGDFNRDGRRDLAVANRGNSTVSVYDGLGGGSFAARRIFNAGMSPFSVDVADLNGDGADDILAVGTNVSVMLGDGFGGFSAPTVITGVGTSLPSARAADVNEDTIPDLVIGNRTTQSVSILLGQQNSTTAYAGPAGDFSTLTKTANGSYTRRYKNGTRVEFNAAGFETAMVDTNGNAMSYGYDGSNRVTSITDPVGKVTTLAYGSGRLTSITVPGVGATNFQHDGSGNLTRITDPDGSFRQFAYDARHRMTFQTSKRNFATSYGYNFAGRNTSVNRPDGSSLQIAPAELGGVINPAGGVGSAANPAPNVRPESIVATHRDGNNNLSSFAMNRFGAATRVVDGLNRTTTITRDTNSNPTRVVAPSGRITDVTYNTRGDPLTVREAVGNALERLMTYTYEPVFNKPATITDPNNKTTTIVYDAFGNPTQITDRANGLWRFTYNARGQVLTATDAKNAVTIYTYDANGNLATVTDAELNLVQLTRDAAGKVTAIAEGVGTPEERVSTFTYDALNRLLAATDGTNATTTFRYDDAGNVGEIEDATGRVQFRTYDQLDRLIEIDDPVSGVTTFDYDPQGNLASVTDARNKTTTYQYDAANQLIRSIDPLLGERLFGYDPNGNLASLRDENLNTTGFVYDLLDRLTSRANQANQAATFLYDSRDNLTRSTDPRNQIVNYTYDNLSRLTQVSTPDSLINLAYDPVGNLLSATDNDSSLAFAYDGLDRVETADTLIAAGTVQPAVTLTSAYDAVGNRVSLADSLGGSQQYQHDDAGRLTRLTPPAGGAIDLAYDPAGRITQLLLPNTVQTTALYDLDGRLQDLRHRVGVLDLARFQYGHDAAGNITQIAELGLTRNFGYDDLNRLVSGGSAAQPETYAYDPAGNRTSSHLSALHSYTAPNRLSGDAQFNYTHDANGNLSTKTRIADSALTRYIWDAQDQLIRIEFPNLTTATYRYDALGRRIEKNAAGVPAQAGITRYLYDGEDILLEYDGANALQARYGHGEGTDQPLAMRRGGQSYYYHADHLGSVRRITDSTGAVANEYDYDAYGRLTNLVEDLPNAFAFTGREFDAESGLHYYRARYYDPQIGRFISEDPIGFLGGINLFAYVGGNPVNWLDPTGTICSYNGIILSCDHFIGPAYDIVLPNADVPRYLGPVPSGQGHAPNERFHNYSVTEVLNSVDPITALSTLVNNPTPGTPLPATWSGTLNDATPSGIDTALDFLSLGICADTNRNPVKSFRAVDKRSGSQLVVNVTQPGHGLHFGVVARWVQGTPTGSIVRNVGEGNASAQVSGSPFANPISGVWTNHIGNILNGSQ